MNERGDKLLAFARLWFVLFFSYVLVLFLFNLMVFGFVDLRPAQVLELTFIPLGQSLVYWLVARRRREE